MRRIFYILIPLFLTGCATVDIPNYVQDQHPYKKIFYSDFASVVEVVTQSLQARGWKMSSTLDPAMFEQNKENFSADARQTILSTEVRQTSFILGTTYSRVNVYIYTLEQSETSVEIRYLKITAFPFKSSSNYRNDLAAERIFKTIAENLK